MHQFDHLACALQKTPKYGEKKCARSTKIAIVWAKWAKFDNSWTLYGL